MEKEIIRLENCLKAMKQCLKIPKVENCVCFSDAFKVLDLEVNRVLSIDDLPNEESKEKLKSLKKEIEEIQKIIKKSDDKECLGCDPCMAAVVFKSYPERLGNLYLDDKL